MREPVAEVPLSAIFQRGTQPAVWVVDKASGTVALRPVTIARWRDETALIASGVEGRRDRSPPPASTSSSPARR